MDKQDSPSEEIVIVGSRYGALADVVKPIYETGTPIRENNIKGLLGFDEVILAPADNDFDDLAVGAYTSELKLIGHVWMCQSPALLKWLKDSDRDYLKARITRLSVKAGVLMATCDCPLKLLRTERCQARDDLEWAKNLPEVLTSLTEQSLGLGLHLLRDELKESDRWTPQLQMRIDNLLKQLPLDLSGHRYRECIELYKKMMGSKDAEVRMQAEILLASCVHRGAPHQMQWWAENWLPSFFHDAAESDLLAIFKSAQYTLEDVEELLRQAPANLFHLYKANRQRFVRQLYYMALPKEVYNRLLTLLAVREAMLAEGDGRKEDDNELTAAMLAKAIAACKALMWGNAAYAVPFCVCRDVYHAEDNTATFERLLAEGGTVIPEGTINTAINRNSWMKYHIDKWQEKGVKYRVLKLRDAFIAEMENIKKQKKTP
jgi:hypothetical protein